jgi:hypothetical protein
MKDRFKKDWQYYKFCLYGFLKNQRFFEPFFILIFLRNKGLNFTRIWTLYSIRIILQFLFEVPIGVAADTTGRRGIMLFAYGFYFRSGFKLPDRFVCRSRGTRVCSSYCFCIAARVDSEINNLYPV